MFVYFKALWSQQPSVLGTYPGRAWLALFLCQEDVLRSDRQTALGQTALMGIYLALDNRKEGRKPPRCCWAAQCPNWSCPNFPTQGREVCCL